MKKKSANQFSINPDKATDNEKALYKQLKDLTDDVRIALNAGINIADNLTMDLKTVTINTGKEIILGSTKFTKVVGVFPIDTARSKLTSFTTRPFADGTIGVTLDIDPTAIAVTFVLIGG